MANENLIEELEQLRDSTKAMADENLKNAAASGSAARSTNELGKSANSTNRAFEGTTRVLKTVGKSASDAIDGLAGFAGGLIRGSGEVSGSFKQLNPLIDGANKAIGGLVGSIPLVGGVLQGLTNAIAEGTKVIVERLDSVSKAFREISTVGGLTSQGMKGVAEQANRSWLSLEAYTQEVKNNSQALAAFRGNVGEGAEDFSKIVGNLASSQDNQLRNLGKSAQDMADLTGSFLQRETRLGTAQGKTVAELTRGSKDYILQLDELSRLTGLSNKQLADQQEKALSEQRFRAKVDELIANGQQEQAQELINYNNILQRYAPDLAQGFRDLSAGAYSSDAAIKAGLATQGKLREQAENIANGFGNAADSAKELQGVAAQVATSGRGLAKVGAFDEVFGSYAQLADFSKADLDSKGQLKTAQDGLKNTTDSLTNSVVSAGKQFEQLAVNINNTINSLLPTAASVASSIAAETQRAFAEVIKFVQATPEEKKKMAADMVDATYRAIKEGAEKAFNYVAKDILGKEPAQLKKEATFGAIGAGAGAIGGGVLGRVLGGSLGSVLGPGGTILGALIGGWLGTQLADFDWSSISLGNAAPSDSAQQYDKARDAGGSVFKGETALVGERGPELVGGPASVLSRVDTKKLIQGLDAFRELRGIRFNDNGFQQAVAMSEELAKITNQRLDAANLPALAKSLGLKNLSIENKAPGEKMNRDVIMDAIKQELNTRPDYAEFGKQLKDANESLGYARGGIADTPSIFGEAGPEAAVPLPDGKTIPVTIDNLFGDFDMKQSADESKELMKTQIEKMDQLIRATEKNMMSDGMMMQVKQLQEVVDKLTKGNEISQNLLRAVRF